MPPVMQAAVATGAAVVAPAATVPALRAVTASAAEPSAPVTAAPPSADSTGSVESVLTSLWGEIPGAPVQSPVSWVMLAAARREFGSAPTGPGPAAAVAAGQPLAPAVRTRTRTNVAPVISAVVLSAPNATTGAVTGTVKAADPNGDRITYTAAPPAKGTVSISTAGVFTYTPTATARHAAARTGAVAADKADTFTVTVKDGRGGSVAVPVTVSISPQNTTPTATVGIAKPDLVTGIARGSVIAGDAERDPLTYAASTPANGAVAIGADGSFTYTPTATARASAGTATTVTNDTFTITVSDGHGGSKVLSVTAIIAPPSTPTLQVIESQGSVSLLRDPVTGTAYVQPTGSPAVAVTRADSYWTGPVPVTRSGATLLAAARDSAGRLRVLDSSGYGQYGWTLTESGLFTGEQKYDATTLPAAETLFGIDLNNDGAIGTSPVGGGGTPIPGTATTGSFPLSLVNSTGGAYRDDQIFVTFLGQTTPGTWSWIDATGAAHRIDHTAADAPGHLVKNSVNYADMSFTLAEANSLPIPPTIQAGRMYVSVGEPLYIRISPDDSGWAGPSPTNPSDPNFATAYDWYEMSYSNGRTAFGGNTTQVDQFGLPLTVTLEQASTGFAQTRGLTLTGDQVFNRFAQTVPVEFQSLLIKDAAGRPLRIVAPRTQQLAALATWLDVPVKDFWTKYKAEPFSYTGPGYTVTGRVDANSQFAYTVTAAGVSTAYTMRKPTTAEIFACDGPFVGAAQQGAFLAELSAAFNRGVATSPSQWNNVAAYYPAGQRWNAYAKFFHEISVGQFAYGFPYDDVNSQSSVQILGNAAPPSRLTISVLAGAPGVTPAPASIPALQVIEAQGSVSLLRDPVTGTAYVQPAGSPAVAVTRADSYWTGPVPVTRSGATLLAAARDSAGRLRVFDSSSYGQYGWTLTESGLFTGEQKYDAGTLPAAETLFGIDANGDGIIGSAPATPSGPTSGVDPKVWTLTWADEFNAPSVSPDPAKWGYDMGGGGYGNAELQYYTNRPENVATDADGHLVITAIKETLPGSGCWYGACRYTSGRILTKNLFTQEYGRFEASMKLPAGQGMWPAFWMQGDATGSAGTAWPNRGELDIMENIGREPGTVHGSLHGPGYSGGNSITGSYTLPAGQQFSDAFHTFAVEWDPNQIRWYVDNTLYQTRTRADLPAGAAWVFDHPFYLILNSAVGGQWPGSPDGTTAFPQQMLIDYVRVYEPSA